jgi:hypothetical protein
MLILFEALNQQFVALVRLLVALENDRIELRECLAQVLCGVHKELQVRKENGVNWDPMPHVKRVGARVQIQAPDMLPGGMDGSTELGENEIVESLCEHDLRKSFWRYLKSEEPTASLSSRQKCRHIAA